MSLVNNNNFLFYILSMLLLHFGTRSYLFSPDEDSCSIFSPRNNCCEFLASYDVIIQCFINHTWKHQILMFHCHIPPIIINYFKIQKVKYVYNILNINTFTPLTTLQKDKTVAFLLPHYTLCHKKIDAPRKKWATITKHHMYIVYEGINKLLKIQNKR